MLKIIIQVIIEIIFPKFCVGCKKKNTLLCCDCYEQIEFNSFGFFNFQEINYVDEIIVVCKYQGVIKKLIHEFKYKNVVGVGKIIARLIYRSSTLPKCDLFIPVPIHKNKKAERGFNQSEEITKELSKLSKISTANFLLKSKNTKSQMSLKNKDDRRKNLINSFEVNGIALKKMKALVPKVVILVDDVVTTGSTLNECAKIIKNNGVEKVVGLAFASR